MVSMMIENVLCIFRYILSGSSFFFPCFLFPCSFCSFSVRLFFVHLIDGIGCLKCRVIFITVSAVICYNGTVGQTVQKPGVGISVPVMQKCFAQSGCIFRIKNIIRKVFKNHITVSIHFQLINRIVFIIKDIAVTRTVFFLNLFGSVSGRGIRPLRNGSGKRKYCLIFDKFTAVHVISPAHLQLNKAVSPNFLKISFCALFIGCRLILFVNFFFQFFIFFFQLLLFLFQFLIISRG